MQLNELSFAGYVGQDAEDKKANNGTRIVSLRVCHSIKGKNGAKDISTWMRVKVFGNWCDLAAKIKKGDNVFIKGPLSIYEYEKDGVKKTSVEMIANSLGILKKDEAAASKVSGNSAIDFTELEGISF